MARQAKQAPSKLCIKCNRVLPLGSFYPNKQWVAQSYRDAWCRDCTNKHCNDKDSLMQYCSQNNRRFSLSCWEKAKDKAGGAVANNADYVSPKTTTAKREKILEKTTVNQYFSMMNLIPFYTYIDNIDENGMYIGDASSEVVEEEVDERLIKPTYSRVWRGTYTPEQIEMLDEQYAKLENDFELDDENRRDYARKVIRASFNADIAEDKYRRGEISLKEYKDAASLFDNLSKSSEFAACKRKPGETTGMGSLGEIILQIELSGALNNRKDEFEQDQIDAILNDYYHAFVAAGIRGEL